MEIALIVELPPPVGARSVVVDADPTLPGGDLIDALRARLDRAGAGDNKECWLERNRSRVDRAAPISDLRLRHGDRLSFVPPRHSLSEGTGDEASDGFELLVMGGPATGTRTQLRPGRHDLGRSSQCAIVIPDDTISRRHLGLVVNRTEVRVADLGSTNGTLLDGRPLPDGHHPVGPGQVIELGDTVLTIAPPSAPRVPHPYADGRLLFNRPPRVLRPFVTPKFSLPVPPERPSKRKFPLAVSVVPVVMGLVMFAFLKQIGFLLFTAMGPIMAIFSLVDDRRSGRKDYTKSAAKFRRDLDRLSSQLAQAHEATLAARRAEAPSPAQLVQRAHSLARDLWERRPGDPDFCSLRIGTADLPTRIELERRGGGDRELRRAARAVAARYTVDPQVPVEVRLQETGVVGLSGDASCSTAVARWLLLQAVTLHSPRDLALVALTSNARLEDWSWLRWLPHTETLVGPGQRSIAADPEELPILIQLVEDLVATRRAESERQLGRDGQVWSQSVLLLVDGDVVPRPKLSRLLSEGPRFGVFAICVANTTEGLPGECRAIVNAGTPAEGLRLTEADTGHEIAPIDPDTVAAPMAWEVALSLAPVRDVGAQRASGEMPSQVLLLDVLGLESPTPAAVLARWKRPSGGLAAPVGLGPTGTVQLDLRIDGPHALVAGTTGSGKSELLQALVSSLAATHPPQRLTFVLVDYKGGAAFKDAIRLPHTVGYFTDLDAHLADRALQSLNAELRRREEVLRTAGARDLVELESRDPERAPASLVIVIDEFAFLKKEVPEFVAGVVDIAQRGRSLGVHLVLATQRPSGVIDDNIRANTNLRIALRVNDDVESSDVIGRPDAARIPRSLPGRAYIRTGHAEVRETQSAFGGAQRSVGPVVGEVRVFGFRFGLEAVKRDGPRDAAETRSKQDAPTDLQRLVSAVQDAATQARIPSQPSPWLDPLREVYPLAALSAAHAPRPERTGLSAPVGIVDEPARQRQEPWLVDLAVDGHLLVYGTSGSGKTTFLRTLAGSLAFRYSPDDLHLYGLDFAGRGLSSLEPLPHCGGVAGGDDVERVERLFTMLDLLIEDRRRLLGDVGCSSLAEYRGLPAAHPSLPYVVVMLDGFAGFASVFDDIDHGDLIDRLARQVADGRGVGIHFVFTADRRSGLPSAITGVVANRIVLRLADEDEYAWLGVGQAAKGAVLPPGRGFVEDGLEIQLAVVGENASGEGQTAALRDLGTRYTAARPGPTSVPKIEVLPAQVGRSSLPPAAPGSRRVPIGIEARTLGPAYADLDDNPIFLVAGPDRSGRTTALRTIARGLKEANADLEAYLFAPRRSALTEDGGWKEVARGFDGCEALALRLAEDVKARAGGDGAPFLVVIDDGDELTEGKVALALETVLKRGRDAGLMAVVSAQTHVLHRTFGGWLREVRKAKHGIVLSPDIDVDGEVFGVRLPRKTSLVFPPGRGYSVTRGGSSLMQTASERQGPY